MTQAHPGRRLQIVLALALLGSAAALALLESRSGVAASLREGRPLTGLLASADAGSGEPPGFFLSVYRPLEGALDVVALPPSEAPRSGGRTLERVYRQGGGLTAELKGAATQLLGPGPYPEPSFAFRVPAAAGPDSAAFRRWLLGWPRGLQFWAQVARIAASPARGELGAYDAVLLAREAYRLEPRGIRPVGLPPGPLRERLAGLLLEAPPAAVPPPQIRVEALNASGEPGVAQRATKLLRWFEVDVIEFGNASEAEPETRFVDRAGRPEDARLVARVLGCPDAEVRTALDPQAAVTLSVILGSDFRRCRALAAEGGPEAARQ